MGKKKMKKYFLLLKPKFCLFLIFSFLSYNICIIELPLIEEEVIISGNSLLLSNIKIGSNNQTFNLILDTGSYITWVPKTGSNDQYSIQNHYDPSKSKTYSETNIPFAQEFSTGNCSGYFYIDNIKYISNNNFKLKFGVADNTNFRGNKAHGIIGLAHYYEDETYSFIHSLIENHIIDSKMFSFKYKEDILVGITAKFILGKHNDFLSKKTVTCPLIQLPGISNKFWACKMSSFGIKYSNYQKEVKQKHNIIFDTGSNEIILPKSFYININGFSEDSRCSVYINDNHYRYSCPYEDRIDFQITINGNTFILSKDLFFYKYENYDEYPHYTTYYSKIIFYEDKCILGMPFFSAFHTLFDKDNEKMHFYPEKDNTIQKYKEKEENKKKNINYTKIIEITFLIIVFLGIITCICIKYRRARREQEKGVFNQLLK